MAPPSRWFLSSLDRHDLRQDTDSTTHETAQLCLRCCFCSASGCRRTQRRLPKNFSPPVARTKPFRLWSSRSASPPPTPRAYNLLCRAYFMIEEWDRGITACERARNLDPQKSLYHLWLGRIYGEKAAGPDSLSRRRGWQKKSALRLNGRWNWIQRAGRRATDLAEFYFEAPGIVGGGKDKARQQADALLPLNPGMAHWVLARIASKEKDAAGAEREYRAAIITPVTPEPAPGSTWPSSCATPIVSTKWSRRFVPWSPARSTAPSH